MEDLEQIASLDDSIDLSPNKKKSIYKGRILSFKNAFEGIWVALKQEPNLKIHLTVATLVLALAIMLKVTKTDFILIVILIGLVVAVELTNTAIETVVDSFTQKEHPGAKLAKDVSSGAVLFIAISAAAAGIIIFLPYIG